jgi:hypothetical protein
MNSAPKVCDLFWPQWIGWNRRITSSMLVHAFPAVTRSKRESHEPPTPLATTG